MAVKEKPLSSSDEYRPSPPGSLWLSTRFGLALLGFFGFVNLYAQRSNLSVGLVCMLNHTAIAAAGGDNDTDSESTAGRQKCTSRWAKRDGELEDGEFVWSKVDSGLLLAAFYWGYIVTQLPGGWLSERVGGRHIFGWSMLAAAIATLLSPVSAHASIGLFIFMRVVIGLGSGVAFPAMQAVLSKWAPPHERSFLVGFSFAGAQIGNVITFPLAALLCKVAGWESVFYVTGSLGLLWCALWLLLVSNSPNQHRRISAAERSYINSCLRGQVEQRALKVATPWKAIFTSRRVWAIVVAHCCADFGVYLMMTSLPTYMKQVLNFDIASNGLFSAVPYIAYFLGINISGWLADLLQKKRLLSTTAVRKIMLAVALIGQAAFFLGAAYCSCGQELLAVACITIAQGLSAAQYAGTCVNPVDIAPQFAGTIFGIANGFSTISGMIAPNVVTLLTPNETPAEWTNVFWVASAILVFGAIFFCLLATGEIQSWARPKDAVEMEALPLSKADKLNKEKQDGIA